MVDLLIKMWRYWRHPVFCVNCRGPMPDDATSDCCSDECADDWLLRTAW